MRVDEFDYDLPEELIAQTPLVERQNSRLMVLDPVDKTVEHRHFSDIIHELRAGDVLVLNNSKVLPARLYAVKPDTGAQVELLLLRVLHGNCWLSMAKPAKRLQLGTKLSFSDKRGAIHATAVVTRVHEDGLRELTFNLCHSTMEQFLDAVGSMPLPPYIHAPLTDGQRYQTVYAEKLGSVAAPTAGLHFTNELLQQVRDLGVHVTFVTLHVGIGTFRPIQVDTVEEHVMHTEWYEVTEESAHVVNTAKESGHRVIAVGTTALRTLESATVEGKLVPGVAETGIYIYPGYEFKMVDALVTNFHLPKSTLMMLISAFMGTAWTKFVYQTAVHEKYRFFSFGDAMLIKRRGNVCV